MGVVADGKTSGVIDSRNAIEALSLSVNWYGHGGSISSRAHVSGIGWQSWSSGTVGTTGQSRSVESVQFKLNDEISATYDIWYRVYASKLGGWLGWTSNGSPAGSVGKGAAIQGIQVMLVEKGCSAPGDTANHFIGATDVLSGSSYGLNGNSLGTVQGKTILMGSESGSEPLTSLSISFDNQETSGSIGYSGCYEFSGWSGVVSDGAALNSKNDGRTLKAVRLTLTGDLSNAYDVWYRCFDSKKGWLGWACNGADAGATIPGSFLKAVEVRIISKGSGAPGVTDGAFVSDTSADCAHVVYQAHSARRGWFPSVLDGQDAGTTGKSLSLQALNVVLAGVDDDSLVEARAHVANIGWQEWRSAGYVGTVGQGLAIQALELRINGPLANQYDIYYRVHSAGYGWLGWAKNGDSAGTTGLNIQIEAVQIKLVAKGGNPGSSSAPAFISAPALTLQAHVATLGWMNPVGNGGVAGTTGRSLAIEALKLNVSSSVSGGIEYSAHVQDVGWQGWTSNGNVAGTVGCAKRIEALKIKLTGDLSNYFDVWYRAYCQDFGWLDWTSNGQPAGTSRIGCRVESVQVKIVPKGASAPGSTSDSYFETYRYMGYQTPGSYPKVSCNSVQLPSYCTGYFTYVTPSRIPYNASRQDCINAFVQRAREYIGTRYIEPWSSWPGDAVDCSGLVLQCLYATGMDMGWYNPYNHRWLPEQTYNSMNWYRNNTFMPVSTSAMQRGDVVYYQGHIGIYIGNGRIIDSWPGIGVTERSVNAPGRVIGAARPFA